MNTTPKSGGVYGSMSRAEKALVSPALHGIFLEEISHAFDGGLYAELIQNRSFEEGAPPPGP